MPLLEKAVRGLVDKSIAGSRKRLEREAREARERARTREREMLEIEREAREAREREARERLEGHPNTHASYAGLARIPKNRDFNPISWEGTSTRRAPNERTHITKLVQIVRQGIRAAKSRALAPCALNPSLTATSA
jgi:hypothetical protein